MMMHERFAIYNQDVTSLTFYDINNNIFNDSAISMNYKIIMRRWLLINVSNHRTILAYYCSIVAMPRVGTYFYISREWPAEWLQKTKHIIILRKGNTWCFLQGDKWWFLHYCPISLWWSFTYSIIKLVMTLVSL